MASPQSRARRMIAAEEPDPAAADVEDILENAALPMGEGCALLSLPGGTSEETCWGENATGEGLITAANALTLTP